MWLKVERELEKNSLNNFICDLSFLKKHPPTDTHPLISIHEFLKPFPTSYYFLSFESFILVECKLGKN